MKNQSFLFILIIVFSCNTRHHPYDLDYPLSTPVDFQKDKISTTNGICFSQNGETLYISKPIKRTFRNGKPLAAIFKSEYVNETWTSPVELTLNIDAYHPVLSVDDSKMFFNSRSDLDTADLAVPHNIWVMEIEGTKWSDPKPVPNINTKEYDSYPSVTMKGDIYFNSNRPGGRGGMDFYVSRFKNGTYTLPQPIHAINSVDEENDLVIDPDEQFVIFNRYKHEDRSLDLYLSNNENGVWTSPKLLNRINSDSIWELTPFLSPNGQYFFYEANNTIKQMDLKFLLE